VLFAVGAAILLAGTNASAHDISINASTTFDALDGGVDDHDGLDNGVFTVNDGDLTIASGGSINCNDFDSGGTDACPIQIVVTGDFTMACNSAILAENTVTGGDGGDITILVTGNITLTGGCAAGAGPIISSAKGGGAGDTGDAGNIVISATDPGSDILIGSGALVTADGKGDAGDITITAPGTITVDGTVSSGFDRFGATTVSVGGVITIDAGCTLTVTGKVSSKGQDQGANLVHLEGCDVFIKGLVESTAVGHAIAAGNLCNNSGHPEDGSYSTCVEIWAGGTLTIDSVNGSGEVSADHFGNSNLAGWVDLYAREDIQILNTNSGAFAVHGVPGSANSQNKRYVVTIRSTAGNVSATGFAIDVGENAAGNFGGVVTIEAAGTVNLNTAVIQAVGDFNASGGFGRGGLITVRSFAGNLSWQNGLGDVRPTGQDTIAPINVDAPANAADRGLITFQNCTTGTVTTTGTTFPLNGDTATSPTTTNVGACGGAPSLPTHVVLPICDCDVETPTPERTTPVVTTPAVTTPAVTTPAVTTPAVTTPAVTTPAVTTPAVTTPAVTTPAVTTPAVTTPAVTTPAVTTPAVTTPAVTTPAVTTPAVTTPAVTTPPATTPPQTIATSTPTETPVDTPTETPTEPPTATPVTPTVNPETQTPVVTQPPTFSPVPTTPPVTATPSVLPATQTPKFATPTTLPITRLPNTGGPGDEAVAFAWFAILGGLAAIIVGGTFGWAALRAKDE
jgi:hypothetical protein